MGGNAGHRHLEVLAHAARGERDFQLGRCQVGVVVEGLVEISQAEEDDGVGVGMLDFQVLAADRSHSNTQQRRCPYSTPSKTPLPPSKNTTNTTMQMPHRAAHTCLEQLLR